MNHTNVQASLDRLKREIGSRADGWELDYYPIGGGYRIMDRGQCPLGTSRHVGAKMISVLDAALYVVRFMKEER